MKYPNDNYLEQQNLSAHNLQTPPWSIYAEQSVIGALMLNNSAWDSIVNIVDITDFYDKNHQLIFRTLAKLSKNQTPFDVITISDMLENTGELDTIGGLSYLGMLAKETPTAENIISYANIVREKSVLRQLIHICTEILDSAYIPDGRDTSDLLEYAESEVFKIDERRQRGQGGFTTLKPLLKNVFENIEKVSQSEGNITGLATGFTDLDDLTSGLQPSDLIILAGRPSMGKTAIAMNIAENTAITTGKSIAIFSLEMPGEALVSRILSSIGQIDQHRIRTGKLNNDEWPKLISAFKLLADCNILIDETPALSSSEVRARSRRLTRDHGQLGLIVVDYLQLMKSSNHRDTREQQISEISRNLKALAKELKVPVLALSQLNRNLESRTNKRPMMSDLRESGAIEQDADLILFVYRDEVYNENSPEKGFAEIIVAKHRNGPLGTVKVRYQGAFTRFSDDKKDIPSIE